MTQNFGVFGYWDEVGDKPTTGLVPDFMLDQLIKYDNGKFSYTPIKYWPNTGDVDFYAYAPYKSTRLTFTTPTDNTKPGYPVFDYTVNPTIVSQDDVLVSAAEDQYGLVKSVNFVFDHALTKVAFAAKTHGDYKATGAIVKITGISLANIINEGSFAYQSYVQQTNKATWWTPKTTKVSYTPGLSNPDGVEIKYKYDNDEEGDGTTYKIVNGDDQYLLLIPQSFAAGTATLKVDYSVAYGSVVEPFTKTFELKGTKDWMPGMFITYAIDISLNMVTFTATVNTWKDASQEFVVIPEDEE